MTSTVFSEAFLTISSIAIAAMLAASIFSGVNQMSNIQITLTNSFQEKMKHETKIIYASIDGNNIVHVWIKNIGMEPIPTQLIPQGDVYFGLMGEEQYIQYNRSLKPTWNYTLIDNPDNDDFWDIGETIQINIYLNTPLNQGDYHVIYSTYLGKTTEYYFST